MTALRFALLAAAALPLAACATTGERMDAASAPVAAAPAPAPAATAQTPHDRLFALFAADDEATLRLNPIAAISRGDLRYADRLTDALTPEYNAALKAQAEGNLAQLQAIDRASLNPTEQIAWDVFAYNQRQALKGLTPERLALTEVRPVNHFFGFHTFYPTFSSGKGAAPFKTVKDYENAMARHREYAKLTDRAIAKFREGMASGVLETRLTIANVISQLDTQIALPVDKSPF